MAGRRASSAVARPQVDGSVKVKEVRGLAAGLVASARVGRHRSHAEVAEVRVDDCTQPAARPVSRLYGQLQMRPRQCHPEANLTRVRHNGGTQAQED